MGIPIFDRINRLLDDKLQKQVNDSQKKIFDDVIAEAQQTMKTRINLDTYYFSHCHRISPLLESSDVFAEIKGIITKYVISQADSRECTKEIQKIVSGSSLYLRDMDYDVREVVSNFYMQYDRAYAASLATKTGMKYSIYLGGLIRDSRDFCVAHNGKVWSKEEAYKWRKWTLEDGEYPVGYEIKQKDKNRVPSYIDFPGYSPLIDLGGYNCRHHLGFISDELAYEMRHSLKK